MPTYKVKFDEDYKLKLEVEVEATDELDAYDKVERLDFNGILPTQQANILLKRVVDQTSAELVIPSV